MTSVWEVSKKLFLKAKEALKVKKTRYITVAVAATVVVAVVCCILFIRPGNGIGTVYKEQAYGFQLEDPAEGEEIVVMHTTMGDIYIRLFPEAAPKAVENFVTHAKNGYYNGLTFHRVINEFMIQGGDPKGNGTGGESIWGETFEDEFDRKLLNLRGALAMANSGEDTNGSQFFINQTSAKEFGRRESYTEENVDLVYQVGYDKYVQIYGESFTRSYSNWKAFKEDTHEETYIYDWIPDEVWDVYEKQGGTISLDGAWRKSGGHTVFGQVFRGMDVVDAIAKTEVSDANKPVKDVVINSIEVTACTAQMLSAE